MNSIEKIGKFELYALLIVIVSTNAIVNIPTIILNLTSTGAVFNILYLVIVSIFFILALYKCFKPFINADILDVSEFLGR